MGYWQQTVRRWNAFSIVRGAIAGAVGTVPMTIFMLVMHRVLPKWQRYGLPPEKITDEMAQRAQVRKHMTKGQILGAAVVSHFGYGASLGSLYSLFAEMLSLKSPVKGALFGLLVWASSYLGWLPMANFSAAAPEEPMRRNTLMIAAHLIWGATTAIADDVLKE